MKRLFTLKTVILLYVTVLSQADGGSLLKERQNNGKGSQELSCCQGDYILSCQEFDIDLSVLGDGDLYLEPLNTTLTFRGLVFMSSNSYNYGNDDVEFIITANVEIGSVYGHAAFDNGKSYVIEYCGDDKHVLKELDVENLESDEGVDFIDDNSGSSAKFRAKRQAVSDTDTIVTYSVKVYYTPQFQATTADIEGFVDQVIQETNQGYINSNVPLRVKKHCTELASISDTSSASTMLGTFRSMKGTTASLRGTADAAALLVNSFSSCGIAYLNTISSGNTVSVTAKNCALGYYSFGHELGHNIGLHHNTAVATNGYFSDGHGHLIAQGSASTGYRTILAYNAAGHSQRVNYYSNPDVNYPLTGTPTGVSGVSNNARVLTVQRFDLAKVGDESSGCSSTTTPPPTATSCSLDNKYQSYRHEYQGRSTQSQCESKCKSTSQCLSWIVYGTYNWCYFLVGKQYSYSSYATGPDPNQASCSLFKSECSKSSAISYIKYIGTAYNITSGDACHAKCQSTSGCTNWNLNKKYNYCYMYSQYYRSYSGWTSGPKQC